MQLTSVKLRFSSCSEAITLGENIPGRERLHGEGDGGEEREERGSVVTCLSGAEIRLSHKPFTWQRPNPPGCPPPKKGSHPVIPEHLSPTLVTHIHTSTLSQQSYLSTESRINGSMKVRNPPSSPWLILTKASASDERREEY